MVEDGEISRASDMRPAHEYSSSAITKFWDSRVKYIWILDYEDGKVYRYDIGVLCNDENKWNPDIESCEAFLYGAGHNLGNCEWMVTSEDKPINNNLINYKSQ